MDLLKILKPGDKVYSLIHGKVVKIKSILPGTEKPIEVDKFSFNRFGSVIPGGKDCLLWPSETEATWDNYSPFVKGDIVIAYDDPEQERFVKVFSHRENGLYYTFNLQAADGTVDYMIHKHCEYASL